MIHALLGIVVLLLATGLVLLGTTRAARAVGLSDVLDLIVAASILAATQIVVTLLFAGVVLRRLDLATVLVVNGAVTGSLFVFLRPARTGRPEMRMTAERLALACRSHPLAAALAALAGLALVWRVVLALILPPYGFDALTFHLPAVVAWLQAGRITTTPLNVCCSYYPQNGEVLVTWPALLGGRMEYVDLVQIAFALVGAVAVAGIARAARVRAPGAWIASSLLLVTPILLAQANTAYVDVTFTSEALAAVYLVLRYLEAAGRERWFLLGCAGATTALCVGTKPTGIVFAFALGLPLGVRAVARRRWTLRESSRAAALFALPIGVLGISWYLRSWIVKGNPFHPMNVKFLGATVFAGTNHLNGPPPQLVHHAVLLQPLLSWYSDLHFWTKGGYSYEERLGGFGPVWSYFGVILVVVFTVHAWRRRRNIFWYFLVPMAILFVFQPDHWWARYTMPLAAVGAIAVAWAITAPWRPTQLRLALGLATFALAAGGAVIASKEVLPGAKFHALGVKAILHDAVHGRRSVGQVFDPDYAWIDKIGHASRVAIDVKTVHMISPFAGVRFQNHLLVLPGRGDLRVFVRTHRVDYVVTRKRSYYDKLARGDTARFTSLGGSRARTYRVDSSRAG